MSRAATIGAEHAADIENAARRFGDHEDMSPARVLNWLLQFADDDLQLALKILKHVTYVNSTNLREFTRQMIQMVINEVEDATPDRTLFVPMGRESGGGEQIVARILRGLQHPFRPRVSTLVDLESVTPGEISVVTFLDDFSGTGDTLAEWWANVEALVRPLGAQVVLGSLVMTDAATERARDLAMCMSTVELGPEANVLGAESEFDDAEKKTILRYCERTGSSGGFVRGYRDSGLLLALRHGCPNNSLPILWYDAKGWNVLFKRRAI